MQSNVNMSITLQCQLFVDSISLAANFRFGNVHLCIQAESHQQLPHVSVGLNCTDCSEISISQHFPHLPEPTNYKSGLHTATDI